MLNLEKVSELFAGRAVRSLAVDSAAEHPDVRLTFVMVDGGSIWLDILTGDELGEMELEFDGAESASDDHQGDDEVAEFAAFAAGFEFSAGGHNAEWVHERHRGAAFEPMLRRRFDHWKATGSTDLPYDVE